MTGESRRTTNSDNVVDRTHTEPEPFGGSRTADRRRGGFATTPIWCRGPPSSVPCFSGARWSWRLFRTPGELSMRMRKCASNAGGVGESYLGYPPAFGKEDRLSPRLSEASEL